MMGKAYFFVGVRRGGPRRSWLEATPTEKATSLYPKMVQSAKPALCETINYYSSSVFKKHAIRPVPAAAPNDSRKHLSDEPLHGMPSIAVRHMNCMDVTCQVTSMGIDYFSTSQ
jgi:hypothetical protein